MIWPILARYLVAVLAGVELCRGTWLVIAVTLSMLALIAARDVVAVVRGPS